MSKRNLMLFAASIFIYSCKKPQPVNDGSQKDPTCRVVTLIWSLTRDTFHITYNNSGKISKLSSGESVSNFEYSGNTMIKTRFDSGVLKERKISTTNAAGLATNIRTEEIVQGVVVWHNQAYQYNGEEVSGATLTYSGSSYTNTITYTWQNHNMAGVKNNISPAVLEFQYYTDKPRQDGDYMLSLHKLLQGYEIFRSKNLLKSVGGIVYQYKFDTAGRIVSAVYTEPGSQVPVYMKYEYECK